MKGPRRRCRGRLIGVLIVPPLFWAAVLTLVPTEWARQRVAHRLGEVSGCPVRLGSLRFGAFGGVWLEGLELGEPSGAGPAGAEPWLAARAVRIDLSLAMLLVGRLEPSRIELRGLDLRLHRRAVVRKLLAARVERALDDVHGRFPCPGSAGLVEQFAPDQHAADLGSARADLVELGVAQ